MKEKPDGPGTGLVGRVLMIDGHIHIEYGDYSLDWIQKFVDNFAFDHTAELWEGIDVDMTYRDYFEDSIALANSHVFDGIGPTA